MKIENSIYFSRPSQMPPVSSDAETSTKSISDETKPLRVEVKEREREGKVYLADVATTGHTVLSTQMTQFLTQLFQTRIFRPWIRRFLMIRKLQKRWLILCNLTHCDNHDDDNHNNGNSFANRVTSLKILAAPKSAVFAHFR